MEKEFVEKIDYIINFIKESPELFLDNINCDIVQLLEDLKESRF